MKTKTLTGTLIFLLLSGFGMYASAQGMSKADAKAWKKKKKAMSVEAFKSVYEDYESLKKQQGTLKRQVTGLQKDNTRKHERLAALKKEKEDLTGGGSGGGGGAFGGGEDYTKGKAFRVQVGTFKNAGLAKYVNHRRFHAEADDDGTKKYTIAAFRDYCEAECFKKALRLVGVTDAWIVAYVDNKRMNIEDVQNMPDDDGSGGGSGSVDDGGSSAPDPADSGGSSGSSGDDW